MQYKTWAWGLSVAAMALLTACGGGDNKPKVRLLNASIGYSSLDMAVGDDEDVVSTGIAYGEVGDYESVSTDDSGLVIQNTTSGASLASTTPSLTSGVKYTLIGYGVSGSAKATLVTENEDTPDSGKSKLQILNLAPDAGAIDIYETATTDTTLDDAATVASSIASGSGSGFTTLKSGTFRLVITAAGDRTDVRLDIPSITLPDKNVSTLVVTGTNGGLLVNAMQLVQKDGVTNYANTKSRVRVVSGLVSGNAVTTTMNDTSILSTNTSPTIGGYTQLTAGTPTMSVTVNGSALSVTAPTLVAGYDYTLLLYGDASAPTLKLLTDDNKLPTTTGYAKIRMMNGLTNNTAGLTLYVDYAAKASNVTPGTASTPLQMAATTDSLVTVTGASSASLFSQDDTDLVSSGIYTVFMLGDGTSASTVGASLVKER